MTVVLYNISEIFYSIQGEGARAGKASVFVRFAGCNLRCRMMKGRKSPGGFDCDTEFRGVERMSASHICDRITACSSALLTDSRAVVLTGGEPMLQIDYELLREIRRVAGFVAVETNGTISVPMSGSMIDYVTVSPKVPFGDLAQKHAHELRVVVPAGRSPVEYEKVHASRRYVSPVYRGNSYDSESLAYCIQWVKENPRWVLSLQTHKWIGIR